MNSTTSLPSAGSTYDETPYPSSSFPQTHPDKLCAIGRLFGLATPLPSRARVLELGCADGANLLPMAQHAPEAQFVGVDASAKQVAAAQATIAATGLTNVEVRHQNILEFPASEGKFDYIIVHGIFSWVPDEVRDKILAICRTHLSENGVAYISYNAFPGWGMRTALRDMMLFHTRHLADPKVKVQQARALTAFLAETVATQDNPYGMLLKQELEKLKGYADNYVRHDILEEINQPFYFHEFVNRAARADLQYLGEPSLDQMLAMNFPEKTQEVLRKLGSNLVAQEQYMDFVRNRNFRQTLLCHKEAQLSRHVSPEIIRDFHYTSVLLEPEPGTLDLKPGVPHSFKVRNSQLLLTADNAFVKAAFEVLAHHAVKSISFPELLRAAKEQVASFTAGGDEARQAAIDETSLTQNLMQLYGRGAIDIHAEPLNVTLPAGEKPAATPLARYQAKHSRLVTARTHGGLKLDVLTRFLILACDGQRDAGAIVEYLVALAKEGKLQLSENDKQIEDETRLRVVLENRVQFLLPKLAEAGYF